MVELDEWHAQFQRQAGWTSGIRHQLYRQVGLLHAERALDVGCGTGVITRELAERTRGHVIGLDIDPQMLAAARRLTPGGAVRYELGDAHHLPYPDRHFDFVTCHFVLLWVADPARAVREMARVTRPGGSVLIAAEPDYGGRIDWPDLPLRQWQIDGLRRQGADPMIGRRLRALMAQARLRAWVSTYPSQWSVDTLHDEFEAEWQWLAHDAGDTVDPSLLDAAKAQAAAALEAGTRLVYVPTFYALGQIGT